MSELNREILLKEYGKDRLINLISLNFSRITKIDSNTFKGLTNLKTLFIYDNELEEIEVGLFEDLSNLQLLYLYNNNLKRIDSNAFKGLFKLETLFFYENQLETIDSSLFESLSNLKVLDLSQNKLKQLDSATFKELTKLETLLLKNNELEVIDSGLFENLSNLKELSLNNNKLKRIDSNSFKDLSKLEKLLMNNNEIEEIEVRLFESLSNLKELLLFSNKLRRIDRKCFEPLKSIERVELYENADLNAVSFVKPNCECWHDKIKLKKYGSVSEWDTFLQQFPQLEEQDLSQLERYKTEERYLWSNDNYFLHMKDKFDSSKHSGNQTNVLWTKSTKVIDYLKQIRMRTIEELKKAQEDTLNRFNLNSSQFKSDEKNIEVLKSQLFADKFYFQVYFTQSKRRFWPLNLFTFVTDLYMSPFDINLLEKSINQKQSEIYSFSQDSNIVFDEKMILIGLLFEYFIENIVCVEKFPNHVIHVRKQDLLNITGILNFDKIDLTGSSLSIDMSKIGVLNINEEGDSIELNIDGKLLPSLKNLDLNAKSIKEISLKNLESVKTFSFYLKDDTLDENMARKLFINLPNIRKLGLEANFSYFDLDNLVNLKNLQLIGVLNDDFNFDFFENLCKQLEELEIHFFDIDDNTIVELFYDNLFPYLKSLTLYRCEMNVLKKKFTKRFPILQKLQLDYSNIYYIDHNAFCNMKQLMRLYLRDNCIERLDKRHFLELVNLKELNLSRNEIKIIGKNLFSNLKNLESLNLSFNQISSLDPESFIGLGNLNSLELQKNKLRRFDVDILDHIPKIEHIDLIDNLISNKDELLIRSKNSLFRFFDLYH